LLIIEKNVLKPQSSNPQLTKDKENKDNEKIESIQSNNKNIKSSRSGGGKVDIKSNPTSNTKGTSGSKNKVENKKQDIGKQSIPQSSGYSNYSSDTYNYKDDDKTVFQHKPRLERSPASRYNTLFIMGLIFTT